MTDTQNVRVPAPSWARWVPFLGSPPPLTQRQWRIMGLIAVAVLFDQYDLMLLSLALKQIQADLSIDEAALGEVGAFVRLGALPSILIVMAADIVGRRRVMLLTIVAYTLFTGLTAFAPDTQTLMWLQFFARMFAVAEVILAYVVIVEEFDAEHRGWGVGALLALGACGNGLALLLFGTVEIIPYGWRALYLVGFVPLVWVAWMRRTLPETERFATLHEEPERSSSWRRAIEPAIGLITHYPVRFFGVFAVAFVLALSGYASSFFLPKYLQDAHGWAPWHYSLLGFTGGFIALFGSAWSGRMSDRHGRRIAIALFLTLEAALTIAFYQTSGVLIPPIWVVMVFSGIAGSVALTTLANELFPTSHRSTASGSRQVAATLGGVLGLYAESALYTHFGSHWTAISLLAVAALVIPFIVYAAFPETHGRRLEDISPDRSPSTGRSDRQSAMDAKDRDQAIAPTREGGVGSGGAALREDSLSASPDRRPP